MVQRVSQSLVKIETEDGGSGSGFIVNARGDVITNSHVVADYSTVTVLIQDGRSMQGTVVGQDVYLDLAYIRLSGGQGNFRAVTLGSSASVSAGQDVLAVGFPLGSNTTTVTRGIVSAVLSGEDGTKWIQTDAPLNPGNSGGPLLDTSGKVIGVVTSRLDYDWLSGRNIEGVGFALAVDELKARMNFLASGGKKLIPTPTPMPTPTPAPTLSPTGYWSTAKSYGSGDFQTAYISLYGLGPLSPDEIYSLSFRCDEGRELQLVLSIYLKEGETYEYSSRYITVQYGAASSFNIAELLASLSALPGARQNRWWQQPFDNNTGYNIFASEEAVDDIVESLQGGDSFLVIRQYLGEWYRQYEFYTYGFDEAAKPVFNFCD